MRTHPGGDIPRVDGDRYGVVVRANGERGLLTEPVTGHHAREALGDVALTVPAIIWPGVPFGDLVMYVDDNGDDKNLPPNHYATELNGTGWKILGDVVVCSATEPDQPLPDDLVQQLLGGPVKHPDRRRPTDLIELELATARRYKAAYRKRPDPVDPYAAEMRADNEREVVQLVAELRAARALPPPTATPDVDAAGHARHVVQQWSAPDPPDRRCAPPAPGLCP
jgi:hypothetical protein